MKKLKHYITQPISIAPLAMFRVIFGLMMMASILRFYLKGWIQELYILPRFHFTYYGFDWVQPLGETGMYLIFAVMFVSAFGITFGLFYRYSTVLFFLTFTYVELIDKSNYLNHYYFVSLVAFLLILVPANRIFSIDALRKPTIKAPYVPAWTINIFKVQLGIVYFCAGLAKLNYNWLFEAMPLKIWLPANSSLPLIGTLFNYELTAYAFSWFGAFYDLGIVFFLLKKSTRLWAYVAVVVFHLMTSALFQIGMFPYIMILSTLIFFSEGFHQKAIERVSTFLKPLFNISQNGGETIFYKPIMERPLLILLAVYLFFQVVLPFRYSLYPGNVFWTEDGYRFSWRVMLMEKSGYTVFNIHDPESGKIEQVANYDYLTEAQEKMMSTQPDMILKYAHFLKKEYINKGFVQPKVTVESFVTLNGKRSKQFIDPSVDLTKWSDSFSHKPWILPQEEARQR